MASKKLQEARKRGTFSKQLHLTKADLKQTTEVFIDGFGVSTMKDKYGSIIYLEWYEGKYWLYVWSDINQEDPTHKICLDEALESNREEDDAETPKVACDRRVHSKRRADSVG